MLSLVFACLWVVLASLIMLLPRRFHWRGAYALAASGVPLLGWVTFENGPFWGLLCLLAGASVLRWPLIRLAQRVRR
jgi:hypothetical protein